MKSTQAKLRSKSIQFSVFFIILACLILMFSCDTFEEDSIAEATPLEQTADITVIAQNSTILDLKSVISINAPVSISITQEPKMGTLEYLGDDLLKYKPSSNVTSGLDIIGFSVFGDAQNFLFSDSVRIEIIPSSTDSCLFTALEDRYVVAADTVALLDVLENDLICDSLISLDIVKFPEFGSVRLVNNRVEYASGSNETLDTFVYTVSTDLDSAVTSALVTVDIGGNGCAVVINDDFFHYNLDVPNAFFDVLYNDNTCGEEVSPIIITQPKFGTASFDDRNLMTYTAFKDSTYMDSLVYEVCLSGTCGRATATFDVIASFECGYLIAEDDIYDLSDTTFMTAYSLDVLLNDTYCEDIAVSLLDYPVNGSATIVNNLILYDPDSTVIVSDSLVYQLCNLDSSRCDPAMVSVIGR
ncbi:MAG: hypothetical protein AAGG59_01805 [Bacteroidota bacterium]